MKKRFLQLIPAVCVLLAALMLNSAVALPAAKLSADNNLKLSANGVTKSSSVSVNVLTLSNEAENIQYAHGITCENGVWNFNCNGKSYNSEFERLLGEEGFMYGMDEDWFGSWTEGTTGFGDNEITGYPSVYRAGYIERELYNMKALGYNTVSNWITINGGGITYDKETGLATGINDSFKKNFRLFLNSCRTVGIDFVPTLIVHGYASNYNQASMGLSVWQKYYRYFRYYYDDEARNALIANVIDPICKILAEYQDIIPMIDLTVENGTNAINDPENGMVNSLGFGTTWENFGKLVNALHACCKKYLPNVPTSVEDVGWESNAFKYNDLDVDIIGRNEYTSDGSVADISKRFQIRPAYLGEYNVSEDNSELNSHSEEYYRQARLKFIPNAIKGGYIGAFYYDWNHEGGGNRCFFSSANSDDYESLRAFAVEVSYTIIDCKNEYLGITNVKDKASLLYNNGRKTNYWAGGRGVKSFELQRSDDGSDWKTIASGIDPYESQLKNGLTYYEDNTMVAGVKYRYRVVSVFEDGSKVTSEPGNETELFVPVEMFLDSSGNYAGSFEEGGLTGKKDEWPSNGWYDGAWGAKIGNFVTGESRTGNYSLYANVSENIGTNSNYTAKWYYNVNLQANTMYQLTFWYKQSAGRIAISVRNSAGSELASSSSVGTTEEGDNEWHMGSYRFTAPSDGKVTVSLMSIANDDTKFYLDDISINEAR